MKLSSIRIFLIPLVLWLVIGLHPFSSQAQSTNPPKKTTRKPARVLPHKLIANALPYTLEFSEKTYSGTKPLPRLQSYSLATSKAGEWILAGGRRQGLHTFEPAPATNFIRDSANNFLYVINPISGQSWSFDVNQLPDSLSAPLQATNQQHYYNDATDQFYIVGGYGWKADKSNMITFNTIIRFKVDPMITAIKSGQSPRQIASLIEAAHDDRLAVTGGELFQLNSAFYLVFGQRFDGQYRAFGGSDFKQTYTEEVRVFTLLPNKLTINSFGTISNKTGDQPFHRRDGNTIDDIDPATGMPRIAAYGGVFKPGIIDAYTYPVYINGPGSTTSVTTANQKFSQYNCPVITVYDSGPTKSVYHTFFGGIGHYYYSQTAGQKAVFDSATQQHRNDGFPFVADISTFLQSAKGMYKEYIHPKPTPGNRLVGSSVPFILSQTMKNKAFVFENEVINLAKIPRNTRLLVGYVYGGVEAKAPLPSKPNTGTFVSNSVFEVYLTYKPFAAIPADQGHESTKSDTNLSRN